MKLLIAGGSGFIGQELINVLKGKHDITVVGRDKNKLSRLFSDDIKQCTWDNLDKLEAKSYQAMINLSGYNISASRWNDEVKQKIISSRVDTTNALIEWAKKQNAKPHFYCANAIGIYGIQDKNDPTVYTENSTIEFDQPTDFLNLVGIKWQQAAEKAENFGIKLTITRFAVVLMKGQGMLRKLAPSFYLGMGSIIGDGQQIISWVHINDVISAYEYFLSHPELTGAFNLTSPNPVTQKIFAKALAKSMHRPLFLKTPAFVMRALFGEMGECLINQGQRVAAKRLLEVGYPFKFLTIDEALKQEYK